MLYRTCRLLQVLQPTNAAEARRMLKSPEKLTVGWFTASWCGPCKSITKKVASLAELNAEKVSIVKIDIDEQPEVAQEYEVESVPTFRFLKGGTLVDSVVGANPDKLKDAIEKLK